MNIVEWFLMSFVENVMPAVNLTLQISKLDSSKKGFILIPTNVQQNILYVVGVVLKIFNTYVVLTSRISVSVRY